MNQFHYFFQIYIKHLCGFICFLGDNQSNKRRSFTELHRGITENHEGITKKHKGVTECSRGFRILNLDELYLSKVWAASKRNIIAMFFLSIVLSTFAQSQSKLDWFPSGLNIMPFTANILEARDGVSYLTGADKLRLDIGTSTDIYRLSKDNSVLTFGADLFTYTRLRSENNFRFPVETIDYFFGLNSGYKIIDGDHQYGFRFRFSHISAHLVDGRFDKSSGGWQYNYQPFVYSREFFELLPFYQFDTFRIYGGMTYLIHVIPDGIGKEIYQAGFDYYFTFFPLKSIVPFAADDFKLSQIGKYSGDNIIMAGIKLGKYNGKGFKIFYSYTSGKSIHGEFYNLFESYSSIGFNFDL